MANAPRLPQLPDVPTFAELGHQGVEAAALIGMVAAVKDPGVQKRLVEFGGEPVGSSAAPHGVLLRSETLRRHQLIRDLKITLDQSLMT